MLDYCGKHLVSQNLSSWHYDHASSLLWMFTDDAWKEDKATRSNHRQSIHSIDSPSIVLLWQVDRVPFFVYLGRVCDQYNFFVHLTFNRYTTVVKKRKKIYFKPTYKAGCQGGGGFTIRPHLTRKTPCPPPWFTHVAHKTKQESVKVSPNEKEEKTSPTISFNHFRTLHLS